jgi:hypothetical protein
MKDHLSNLAAFKIERDTVGKNYWVLAQLFAFPGFKTKKMAEQGLEPTAVE